MVLDLWGFDPVYLRASKVIPVWCRADGDALCVAMVARHKRELVESFEAGFG